MGTQVIVSFNFEIEGKIRNHKYYSYNYESHLLDSNYVETALLDISEKVKKQIKINKDSINVRYIY